MSDRNGYRSYDTGHIDFVQVVELYRPRLPTGILNLHETPKPYVPTPEISQPQAARNSLKQILSRGLGFRV